jgi:hypothetical protein
MLEYWNIGFWNHLKRFWIHQEILWNHLEKFLMHEKKGPVPYNITFSMKSSRLYDENKGLPFQAEFCLIFSFNCGIYFVWTTH